LRGASKCRDSYDIRTEDGMFTQMPFFWVGGLTVNLLAVMSAGGTQLTTASSNPAEVLEFLEREQASNVMAWPHLARAIAADPTFADRNLSCVRVGSLWEAWPADRRPADPTLIGSALGMTETAGPHTTADMAPLPEHRRGSFGPPQAGMSHRVIDPATGQPTVEGDVGELLVRGDTLMLGMVRREGADVFEPDGWYRTSSRCATATSISTADSTTSSNPLAQTCHPARSKMCCCASPAWSAQRSRASTTRPGDKSSVP
jgi:acyl-CoA synthetase (AMP-forming)/AMP-acid ligase II